MRKNPPSCSVRPSRGADIGNDMKQRDGLARNGLNILAATVPVTAALLIGVGSAIGLAGVAVGVAAFATAGRRWYSRADLTPGELARLKWEQTKAVVGAGSGAWRETELAKYSPRSERVR